MFINSVIFFVKEHELEFSVFVAFCAECWAALAMAAAIAERM